MNSTQTVPAPRIKPLWRIDRTGMDLEEGGFSLVPAELNLNKYYLAKGALLSLDYTTRLAHVQKTATVITGSTTTKTRVAKDNLFIVGNVIAKEGANAVAITAIDTANETYDELTHLTNGAALVAGDVLIEALALGASAAVKYTVDALLNDTTKLVGTPTVTAKVVGYPSVKTKNLIYPVTAAIKTAMKHFRFV